MVNTVILNELADELLEEAVLRFDQEAVVFIEKGDELHVKKQYQPLRDSIYDILDNKLS